MDRGQFPARYEPLSRLGKGGGGEVWAVVDRHTSARCALKMLSPDASEGEMAALVREAVALSGLEGLGVPQIVRFGRLPGSGRPFMVRELVDGASLQALIDEAADADRCLRALARCAEQVTLLHRAGLLHGDIKPANVIVEQSGRATLVDLGLAAPWRDRGTAAKGLTPKYAAPELLEGKPLTVRAEVYALGVTLSDIVDCAGGKLAPSVLAELRSVAERATRSRPTERFPSADEFASALRRAGGLGPVSDRTASAAGTWPIVGIEATASRLLQAASELGPGEALVVRGPEGAGKSVLLRRLAWSLEVEGRSVAWIDEQLAASPEGVKLELSAVERPEAITAVVDGADELSAESVRALRRVQERGARLVIDGDGALGEDAVRFDVPPLGEHAATELVRRAVPSLTDRLIRRAVRACGARPGKLREFVRAVASRAIASDDEVEELLGGLGGAPSVLPEDPLDRAVALLDRGRFDEAREALGKAGDAQPLERAIARARLSLGYGDAAGAREQLLEVSEEAERVATAEAGIRFRIYFGRAHIGLGEYARATELLDAAASAGGALGAEALAYRGLALGYLGEDVAAEDSVDRAVDRAREAGAPRVAALALACRGILRQRADDLDGARWAYGQAIEAAEEAGDASTLATAQLNLAGLMKMSGDMAGAIEHFEAAVDMGRRSGRRSTVRQALLSLANTDLYLGRLARARSSIEALDEQVDQLPRIDQAQLLGRKAELYSRTGEIERAVAAFHQCASILADLGLGLDAAEARLEGVLVASRSEVADAADLERQIERARADLGESQAHRALLALAEARVALLSDDEAEARRRIEEALAAARQGGQREWIWRTLEARAEVEEAGGQPVTARRDREEALATLEEIAARLPRDLREVFWNDPRRQRLRAAVEVTLGSAATEHAAALSPSGFDRRSSTSSITSMTSTPLERRLARILEINTELLGEVDVDRLCARVTDHAVDLLRAERGFVILKDETGALSVHTSRGRGGESSHEAFSKSVAQTVIDSGEPVVSLNARGDSKLRGFESVHHLMLESVACVPIASRDGGAIGALYAETRLRPGVIFERELPTLRAFADQVGIALETASLISENDRRARALAKANRKLEKAQAELKELLGDRTEKLKRTREKLRDARDTLYGHFGYQGLVGTSDAMRRVYALIDRVKDTGVPVLITGESGTGKELAARAIHQVSERASKPFLGVNCGAIPEHLLESELFGHVRGAFTGADRERKGLFREAEGGTVLLDEIGEMPHKMQAGLLRVLQEHKVRPVGGTTEEPVDVRLIFATHRNLDEMVREGRFREDLYYRIVVVEVPLPPLRDRVEDIAPLVDHFLGIFAARYKRERRTLSRAALRRLMSYDWPGNVRQLEHVLLNAWVLSDEPVLEPEDFDLPDGYAPRPAVERERLEPSEAAPIEAPAPHPTSSRRAQKKETLSKHRRDEKERILQALKASNWNRVKAAELSGIPRRTFYRRLRQYGIQ